MGETLKVKPSRVFEYICPRQTGRVDLIADTALVLRNPRAEYRGLDEGGVLTQLDTGQYHGLNPVGALIWSLIDGQAFLELVEAVRSELTEPPLDLAEDMAEFIEALKSRKLVDVSNPQPV